MLREIGLLQLDENTDHDHAIGGGNLERGLNHDVPLYVVQVARIRLQAFQKSLHSISAAQHQPLTASERVRCQIVNLRYVR